MECRCQLSGARAERKEEEEEAERLKCGVHTPMRKCKGQKEVERQGQHSGLKGTGRECQSSTHHHTLFQTQRCPHVCQPLLTYPGEVGWEK